MASGEFGFPTIGQSDCIFYNAEDIKGVSVKVTSSGTVRFSIGYSNTLDTSIVWEELSSAEQVGSEHLFSSTGQYIYWKAIGNVGSSISMLKIKMVR